ncbi:MAG: PEGA domain-containing protein [Muribaculaceae bacterium]|nr:PEGA domain-containing protein [Muribaculaceae bacterium]
MKKLFLIFATLLGIATSAHAQDDGLKYSEGTFRDRAEVTNSLAGSGMGAADLAPTAYFQQQGGKYKLDENGDPTNAAIVVFIKNLPLNEFDNIRVNVEGVQITNPTRRTINGREAIIAHVRATDSGRKYNRLTVNHPQFGTGVLLNPVFKTGHIYEVEFINARRTNVSVNTTPAGMKVIFDGKDCGTSPVSIPNVSMGEHEIEIPSMGATTFAKKERIEIDDNHTSFSFDLRKQRTVTFKASRKNARLTVYDPNTQNIIGQGYEAVTLQELPFGVYKVVANLDGKNVFDENLSVDQHSPSIIDIAVVKKKSINFIAYQNNRELRGATVSVKGEGDVGLTPLTREMEYGSYNITMSSGGKHKDGKLKVNDNTSSLYELVLPNPSHYRSRWNPFDTDYNKREWGFSFGYVNKQYIYSIKNEGRTYKEKYNNWLEQDKMMHGFEMGIVYQPYFGSGQGLITGLFWQYFIGDVPTEVADDDPTDNEHNLMVPLLYQFRLPVSEDFSLYLCGGIEMVLGLSHSLSWDGDDDSELQLGFGHNDDYGFNFPNRFQLYAPVGGGFQYKALQIDFKYSWGLTDSSHIYEGINEGFKQSFKGRMMEATLHLVF